MISHFNALIYRLKKCIRGWMLVLCGKLKYAKVGSGVQLNVPVRINGLGSVVIGDGVSLGYALAPMAGSGEILIQARPRDSVITIGPRCAFSNNVSIVSCVGITVGADCLIGDGVLIIDSDFHGISPGERRSSGVSARVSIGDNVWLGSRVIVLKGVNIGSCSVIGAGSVVVRDIPPNSVAAGNPAVVLRTI